MFHGMATLGVLGVQKVKTIPQSQFKTFGQPHNMYEYYTYK